jgi:hypothetical protein
MIKNYTSEVPASRSVAHIEEVLMAHGATSIMKLCEGGSLSGIAFVIKVDGKEIPFKLPARIDRIEKSLLDGRKHRITKAAREKIALQAQRTAWKLLSEWIDINMTFVDLDQSEITELFTGFIYDTHSKTTFFEHFKSNGFAMIEDKR